MDTDYFRERIRKALKKFGLPGIRLSTGSRIKRESSILLDEMIKQQQEALQRMVLEGKPKEEKDSLYDDIPKDPLVKELLRGAEKVEDLESYLKEAEDDLKKFQDAYPNGYEPPSGVGCMICVFDCGSSSMPVFNNMIEAEQSGARQFYITSSGDEVEVERPEWNIDSTVKEHDPWADQND